MAADSRCWLQAGLQQRLWVSWAGANPHMRPCTRPTPLLTGDGGGWPVARGEAAWKSKNRDPAAVSGKITEYLAF